MSGNIMLSYFFAAITATGLLAQEVGDAEEDAAASYSAYYSIVCDETFQAVYAIEAEVMPLNNFILYFADIGDHKYSVTGLRKRPVKIKSQIEIALVLLSDLCRNHIETIPTRPIYPIDAITFDNCEIEIQNVSPSLVQPARALRAFRDAFSVAFGSKLRFGETIMGLAFSVKWNISEVIDYYDSSYRTAYRFCQESIRGQ